MKALSIRQPWAWLVVHGYKDIENRDWYTSYRGRIYIHASKQFDDTGWDFIKECMPDTHLAKEIFKLLQYWPISKGFLVGEVDIIDCVKTSDSKWFVGGWGFVLDNSERYIYPIPHRGQLGLFEVKGEYLR